MTRQEEIIRNFYKEWDTIGMRNAFLKYLHPDVVKEDTGFGKTVGLEMAMKGQECYLEIFKRPYARVEVRNLAVNGNTVMTERIEHCENRENGDTYTGYLMSTFVLEGDKIIRWADYYDPADYKYGKAVPRTPAVRELMKMWSKVNQA